MDLETKLKAAIIRFGITAGLAQLVDPGDAFYDGYLAALLDVAKVIDPDAVAKAQAAALAF